MSTIASVFKERSSGPYVKDLKVKVVAASAQSLKYKGKDGTQKESLTAAVSDGLDVVEVVCFDAQQFRYFKENKYIRLRNFINKTEATRSIVVTSHTKVAFWSPLPVTIPQEHHERGMKIVSPPSAEVVPISVALSSPKKTKTSIQGRLVQEEEVRTVRANGEDVQIKIVTMEDKSGKTRVTLWRDAVQAQVRPGDHLEISNVMVNLYQGQSSLSTTMRSSVKKIEAPVTEDIVTVVGLSVNGGNVELCVEEEEEEVILNAELLQDALFTADAPGGLDLEEACQSGPFTIKISRKGSEILSIEKVEIENN